MIIIPPNKLSTNSTAAVTELVDRFYGSVKKVISLSIPTSFPMVVLSMQNYVLDVFVQSSFYFEFLFVQVVLARGCFDDTKV